MNLPVKNYSILVCFNGELYGLNRKVKMHGMTYFVHLNGELRCTQDLKKPFSVEKLPKGAKKLADLVS